MTIYEKIKSMTPAEVEEMLCIVYNAGWHDSKIGQDDELYYYNCAANDASEMDMWGVARE